MTCRIPLLIAASTALFACTQTTADSPSAVTDSAGIRIVTGATHGSARVQEPPVLTIGTDDHGPEYLFTEIVLAARLPTDHVVVADSRELSLRWYSAAGEFLFSAGREGEGPGEFRRITHVTVTPGGGVAVFDSGLNRVSWFSPEGAYLASSAVDVPNARMIGADSTGAVFLTFHEAPSEPTSAGTLVRSPVDIVDSRSGTLTRSSSVAEHEQIVVLFTTSAGSRGRVSYDVPLSAPVMAGLTSTGYVIADATTNQLVYRARDGRVLQIARVADWTPRSISGGDRNDYVNRVVSSLNVSDPERNRAAERAARERLSMLGSDRRLPAMDHLIVGEDDEVWVRDYAPGASERWRHYDSAANLVAVVEFPEGFVLTGVSGSSLTGYTLSTLGVPTVQVYDRSR
jgi:hypothetical protein